MGREMVGSSSNVPQRFFFHYPEGHRLYVCIVDQQRRAFDLTDNTFKPGNKLACMRDACLYADGNHQDRADHHYSYSVEIDLSRLLNGSDPATNPVNGEVVTVHWLEQLGDDPAVTVDKRLHHSCGLRRVDGRFEPANKYDADLLDENLAFERREADHKQYCDFILREIDVHDEMRARLGKSVQSGDVSSTLRVLADDLCLWAGNLKQHLLHHVSHFCKDPTFIRMRNVPENAPFRFVETWVVRDWIGSHEAFDLLEFHKSTEYARSFSARLETLHSAAEEFSEILTKQTVQSEGKIDVEMVVALDETRKELKHKALWLAEHIDVVASQFDAAKPVIQPLEETQPSPTQSELRQPVAEGPFNGGEIVFYQDHVEFCGVDICRGRRSRSRRIVLELLSKQLPDRSFVAYSGDELEARAKEHGAKGTAGRWIDDLRYVIMERLRNQIGRQSKHKDVVLSGGPGYRFAEGVSVQFAFPPAIKDITDITDTDDATDVPNDDVRDVFDVRDDAAATRRAWILGELAKGRRLKGPDVADHFGCSVKTAHRDLKALKDEGVIEFVDDPRTGYYRLLAARDADSGSG